MEVIIRQAIKTNITVLANIIVYNMYVTKSFKRWFCVRFCPVLFAELFLSNWPCNRSQDLWRRLLVYPFGLGYRESLLMALFLHVVFSRHACLHFCYRFYHLYYPLYYLSFFPSKLSISEPNPS